MSAEAQLILTEDLPVSDVDFLLWNGLAGGGVWIQPPSTGSDPDVKAADVDSVTYVTRPREKRAPWHRVLVGSMTVGIDYNKAKPLPEEYSVCVDATNGGIVPKGLSCCWQGSRRVRVGLVFELVCWS